ncbi:gp53-like domain-containing protein [Enterobacter cloacae]|uniref:gp53-like domain-containing protein n=1 Tax=Enterobacter cloacae TaxID=550 RepID=UPI002003B0AC|nr:hypothetical protein [Enterobacter cloacae]MCK7163653.1 hypothetical protein [Enterobacter cloacae]
MHRIDTPTAQADKFGPGKNGFTNGDPATGRRATDLNSDMWDAVQEEICTVVEKAGLALNKEQHDQLHQAIEKIITSKIPDALLKKNNLSDLADKALARANLQLKAAATKDVTTQYNDTNGGRLMTLGCRGIGGSSGDMLPGADVNTAAKYLQFLKQYGGGIYRPIWNSAVTNPGGLTKYSVNFFGNTGDTFGLISIDYNSGKTIVVGANQAGIDSGKVYVNELYGTLNKPTAGDVGAVAKAGDTMTGALTAPGVTNTGDYSLRNLANRHVRFEYLKNDGTWTTDGYIYKDGVDAPNRRPGVRINCATPDKDKGNTANSGDWVFGEDGNLTCPKQVIPGSYVNFDARYYTKTESDGRFQPKGNYTPAGQAYTKAESDGRFQPKGNYTPAGQAYTKGESDARYQLKNTASRAANGWFKDTTTGMIYQWGRNASSVVGNTTVTFPIAFPNACLNVQNTLIRNSGSAGERPWGFVTSFNNTSVNLSSDATGSYWYAIGY